MNPDFQTLENQDYRVTQTSIRITRWLNIPLAVHLKFATVIWLTLERPGASLVPQACAPKQSRREKKCSDYARDITYKTFYRGFSMEFSTTLNPLEYNEFRGSGTSCTHAPGNWYWRNPAFLCSEIVHIAVCTCICTSTCWVSCSALAGEAEKNSLRDVSCSCCDGTLRTTTDSTWTLYFVRLRLIPSGADLLKWQ